MAPIYDTDLAEERFAKDEWSTYELWEKVEIRLRRRKYLWIGAAVVAFLALSSVPIVMSRLPKWKALAATRRLAQEINRLKREASSAHAAYRIRFAGNGSLDYVVEKSDHCSSAANTVEWRGSIVSPKDAERFSLVTSAQGSQLGVGGFTDSFCYDYLAGADIVLKDQAIAGFGVIPVNDLTEGRIDRLAILLVAGPSGEASFE